MKKELNIFDVLKERGICYSVNASETPLGGMDYFIVIANKDKGKMKRFGFQQSLVDNMNDLTKVLKNGKKVATPNKYRISERSLERDNKIDEIEHFLKIRSNYKRVQLDGKNSAYELPKNSFKKYYDSIPLN